jgi:hypothetical protein
MRARRSGNPMQPATVRSRICRFGLALAGGEFDA